MQALKLWKSNLSHAKNTRQKLLLLIDLFYEAIAGTIAPEQPGRSKPRVVKPQGSNHFNY